MTEPAEITAPLPGGRGLAGTLEPFKVLRHRGFRRLWIGLTTSTSGTSLRILAASILIFQQTHSAAWVGALNFLGFLPIVFLSLVGGLVVDRRGSRSVLVWAQSFSMCVSGSLAFLAAVHRATPLILCSAVFLLGCSYSFTKPAAQSLIPVLVPPDVLTAAIGVNGLQFTLGLVFGPITAAFLLAFFGFASAFAIDACTFGVLLLVALSMPRKGTFPHADRLDPQLHPAARPARTGQIREALRFVSRDRLLLILLLGIVSGTAGIEMVKTLMPVFVVQSLDLSPSTSGYP